MDYVQEPFIEPIAVLDVFASGLAYVEDMGGGCFRYTFYVEQRCPQNGDKERVIIARLIMPEAGAIDGSIRALEMTHANLEPKAICPAPNCQISRRSQ